MKSKPCFIIFFSFIAFCFTLPAYAEMASENNGIVESVFSNGGGPMASESFGVDSTLGQPSSLMEDVQPASTNYGLYPGFWYPEGEVTLIQLASFSASPGAGKVIVEWSTASEIDNAGFNIYRAESENGAYTKINTAIISAKGSSSQGAAYEFVDDNVKNRKTYYYKLEDIDLNGMSTMHGPVKATPRLIYGYGR